MRVFLFFDSVFFLFFFFFQAEDGIRDVAVTGVQTCALPICDPTREGVGLVDFRLGPDEPAQTEPSRRRDRPRARSWRVDGVRHADAPRRAHQAQGVTSPDTATTCGGARLDIGVMTVQERRSP